MSKEAREGVVNMVAEKISLWPSTLGGCYDLGEWSVPVVQSIWEGHQHRQTQRTVDLIVLVTVKNHCQFTWPFDRNREHKRRIFFTFPFYPLENLEPNMVILLLHV